MNPFRWLKSLRFRLFYAWLTKPCGELVTLGSECPWAVDVSALYAESQVLSAGVGNDVSFEKALVSRFAARVVLLDPSPTGITTMARENLPEELVRFLPVALAGKDGELAFQPPADPQEGSFRKSNGQVIGDVRFPSKTLSTLMSELRWQRIDLLKLDIEGAEYEVIDHLLERNLDVRQICVEFHYGRGFAYTRWDMVRRILALRRRGFDLVGHVYQDHTFLRRSCRG